MKLSKRIAAGFLAAAMMATMAFPAFADGTTTTKNYYATGTNGALVESTTANSSYSIPKTYTSNNTEWKFDTETLSLKVEKITDYSYPAEVAAPSFDTVSVTENGVANDAKFTATLPTYSKIGKYIYKVTEESTNKQTGATYQDVFYMQVQVTAHETGAEGSKTVVASAYDVNVTYWPTYNNGAVSGTKITKVDNKIKDNSTPGEDEQTNGLKITKTVKGTAADPDAEYTFKVTFAKAEDAKALNLKNVKLNGSAYTVNNDSVTFSLKANETATITGVPLGATYTIQETNKNNATSVDWTGATKDTTDTTKATGTIASLNDVGVTNNFGDTTPDTGVILDNAPYIVMIAVVAAAAVVFVISKKRREE